MCKIEHFRRFKFIDFKWKIRKRSNIFSCNIYFIDKNYAVIQFSITANKMRNCRDVCDRQTAAQT